MASIMCVAQDVDAEALGTMRAGYAEFLVAWDELKKEKQFRFKAKGSMGSKIDYITHIIDWMSLFGFSPACLCEQSVEAVHQVYKSMQRRFAGVPGLQRLLFMMKHVLLHTSPKYQ